MIQIRNNIFETNSSSVHSITICTEEDFQQWKKGNLIWSYSFEKLIKPPISAGSPTFGRR